MGGEADLPPKALLELRRAMSAEAGVVRDAAGLTRLLALIEAMTATHGQALPLTTARLIAEAALARRESRGGHWRADYPATAVKAEHTRLLKPKIESAFRPLAVPA